MNFPVRFFICNLFISLLLALFLVAKKRLKNHLTLSMQYRLWGPLLLALALPFVPYKLSWPEKIFREIRLFFSQAAYGPDSAVSAAAGRDLLPLDLGIRDFSAGITGSHVWLAALWGWVWAAGMLTAAAFLMVTVFGIYRLRRNGVPVTKDSEPALYGRFQACMGELRIRRRVRLYASCGIQSPVSYGWLRPEILIPQDLDIRFSDEEIRYILLHELQHCRNRDTLLNGAACILQIFYWFNPLVWYGFMRMRRDREAACDHAVIQVIGKELGADYGRTLLKYAEHMRRGVFLSPVSGIGGSRHILRQRIQEIVDHQADSLSRKAKSMGIFLLTLLIVFGFSPLYTAYAGGAPVFRLSDGDWEAIDLSSDFEGINGAFVFYDTAGDHFQIYNKELCEQRVSPESTYKIYSALFALEEGVIAPGSTARTWDGSPQPFAAWNQDQTLRTAMENSVNWYFQDLDGQTGLPALYRYYDRIGYGNRELAGGTSSYWTGSSLKISPVEQVVLLSGLLENKWGFQEENLRAVKEALFLAETPAGTLYGKTGTGRKDEKNANGWFVGFLERPNGQTCCFAANLRDSEKAAGSAAFEITWDVLQKLL